MLPDMSKKESQKSQGLLPPLLLQLVQLHLEGGDLLVDPLEVPPAVPEDSESVKELGIVVS